MDFREVWDRVRRLSGESFHLPGGEPFAYSFKRTFVVITPGGLSLPKTNFEKVQRLGDGAAVQGRKHIRAILDDPRIASAESETES